MPSLQHQPETFRIKKMSGKIVSTCWLKFGRKRNWETGSSGVKANVAKVLIEKKSIGW